MRRRRTTRDEIHNSSFIIHNFRTDRVMIVFKLAYWAGILIEMAIRAPLQKTRRTLATTERHVTTTEKVLLGLLFVAMFLIPLIYSTTNWLDFADYTLPAWMG